ncbi:hypothetical protein PCL_03008 [Purpureocillium lilacinum]|uniref:Uncharacterized protein n=1 Tax=Purpureocillium lilacinum TaxID=33203 RepID=A0A2U3DNT8_PURLI|nr:hypothetical protein PCL_03008 [Purpureocillium lilacinum]
MGRKRARDRDSDDDGRKRPRCSGDSTDESSTDTDHNGGDSIDEDEVHEDANDCVTVFVEGDVTMIRMVETKGYNDAPLAQFSDELHQRAGNTFLWVALICNKVWATQWAKRLSFIAMSADTRQYWDVHQQTLEGHAGWVTAVAFAPGGKTLATASDEIVRLLELATGAHQQTLEGQGFGHGHRLLARRQMPHNEFWIAPTLVHVGLT